MTYCLALKSLMEGEQVIVPAERITHDFAIYKVKYDEEERILFSDVSDVRGWVTVWLGDNIRFKRVADRGIAVKFCVQAQQRVDALENEEDRKNEILVWNAVRDIEI